VLSIGFSNQIDDKGIPINLRNVLQAGTRAVRAAIQMQGAKPGMTVQGRWYQLGPAGSAAEGAEISTSEVQLTSDNVNVDTGQAAIFFTLGTSGPALPEDTWLLRVYVNGKLVKTGGFVISSLVGTITASPAPAAPPAPTPTP
jgi:hypothetical protein